MNTKTYSTRDNATAALRRLGVPKNWYGQYLTASKTGGVTVDFDKVNAQIAAGGFGGEPTTAKKVPKEKTAPVGAKPKRVTVASRVRELIAAGKDNKAIWAVLQSEFKLGDEKKHYPAWYRSQTKRLAAAK